MIKPKKWLAVIVLTAIYLSLGCLSSADTPQHAPLQTENGYIFGEIFRP